MEVAQPPVFFHFPRGDTRRNRTRQETPEEPNARPETPEEPNARPVPNHLLESKIYSKLGRNGAIEAEPPVLYFGGYEVGKCHRQVLKLINVSPDVSSVHVIPPQSKHFTISYKKANRLVPGLALTVQVQFIADEWRYYYDCVRIHCKGDETLLVPLHAFPASNLRNFPCHMDLCVASLGQSAQYILPLRCSCPVDFEFHIECKENHKDFHISPTSGIFSGNVGVDVTVTFTPSSYGTAQISLELQISEFNAKPYTCIFTGTCSPNLSAVKEGSENIAVPSKVNLKSPEKATLGISRKKRHLQSLQQKASRVIEFQNLRFPLNLSNPHAVASVLNQQPGKRRLKDMREGLTDPGKKTRQEKETLFQQLVQQNVAEEEANQLRWQIHRGCDPASPEIRHRIRDERRGAEEEHQVISGCPDFQSQYKRQSVCAASQRVLRRANQHVTVQPQFDLYLNELWAYRNRALRRFQQAARKVLIRCRVNGRLTRLRKLLQQLRSEQEEDGTYEDDEEILSSPSNQILFRDFPPYPADPEGPNPGGLCGVIPQPAVVQLKVKLPFYDLKVPQHYKLMGYQPLSTHSASSTYHSRQLARPLRSGAEDELVPIAISPPDVPGSALSQRTDMREEEHPVITNLMLSPPEQLLNPPDFHPMHVFNPAPGLVAFKRPLPYSETNLEYHLCPLPKYPSLRDTAGITQRNFLNREEIIRGVMSWKKFPSVALSASLPPASSHRPRWCDPFSSDLLPTEAPPTLSHLPEEDKENLVPRETDEMQCGVLLTPEMLRAEFTFIQHGSQSDRDPSDQQPEWQSPADGDSLADRIQRHLGRVKLLTHNKKLVLD
ncbi:cilia- and flagella-associated protein 221 [Mantella aurantiaca]